ncbi:hypothetical protein [Streptomyces sp. NBC_01506]|uniref:hypothetical protein n=1 Tax=Streptomyces sp. NBC_01506 TaxID=2903887 RepID=UPI0038687F91
MANDLPKRVIRDGTVALEAAVPVLHSPAFEPVAHPECRICYAANRGRTAARLQNAAGRVREFNRIIEDHRRLHSNQGAGE